jgi:hypothetical protein
MDCAWCTEDLCAEPWPCVQGHCTSVEAVVCDESGDTECQVNQCDPATGVCAMSVLPDVCDDDDPCTADSCSPDGTCEHQSLIGCQPEPPFECLGSGEPSAEGCGMVESYEGCCDPWGRVTWCQDGATYCISCQENPTCGWQDTAGYYDCGTPGGEDPSGAAPLMCSAFTLE